MRYSLYITQNQGYGWDQVRGAKVSDLLDLLNQLDEDDEIYLCSSNNIYGASWHSFNGDLNWALEEIEEEESC